MTYEHQPLLSDKTHRAVEMGALDPSSGTVYPWSVYIPKEQKPMSLESEIAAEIVASREEIKQAAIDKIVGQLVASTYETIGYEFQVRLDRALDEMVAKAAASIKAAKYRDYKTGEEISFEEKVKRTLLNFLGESALSAPE